MPTTFDFDANKTATSLLAELSLQNKSLDDDEAFAVALRDVLTKDGMEKSAKIPDSLPNTIRNIARCA